ncbi:MAG: hypothetical protein MHM6MM_001360 [Cercozoa sp. M6MM]
MLPRVSISKTGSFGVAWWHVAWLLVSAIVCTYDALFVLLRPRTLPGGDLNWIFSIYDLYIQVDKNYGVFDGLGSGFLHSVAYLNLVEVGLSVIALLMLSVRRSRAMGALLTLAINVAILWKTALFFSFEILNNFHSTEHNDRMTWWLLYVVPNGIWLLMPLLTSLSLMRRMAPALSTDRSAKKHD